jgi:hypothetical protein
VTRIALLVFAGIFSGMLLVDAIAGRMSWASLDGAFVGFYIALYLREPRS